MSELVRSASGGDADAIEGLLSLALSDDSADSSTGQQARETLHDILEEDDEQALEARGEGIARTRRLARLEAQAQCFELVEKDGTLVPRMPDFLLQAAGRHAAERGYHVTGDEIRRVLASRRDR